MRPVLILISLLIVSLVGSAQCWNVLFYFGLSSYSHRIVVWPLAEALADAGHNVTFLQPFKNKKPNPKVLEITTPVFMEDAAKFAEFLLKPAIEGRASGLNMMLPTLAMETCEKVLNDTNNHGWIESSTFDLVIIDGLLNDCGYFFAHKYKAKTVIFSPTHPFSWYIDNFGLPVDTDTYVAPMNLPYESGEDIPFSAKLTSLFQNTAFHLFKYFYFYPKLEKIASEYPGFQSFPPLSEIEVNTSLVLFNSHFSEEFPRALPPMIIGVGGMHCTEKTNPLPKDLQDFLKGDAFFLMSFGSSADLSYAPEETISVFLTAFKNIGYKIIWKWGNERPKNMPKNVYTSKWIPQQDILASKNIVGLITHGGLLSLQEATFHKVPVIAIPLFAEQHYNAKRVVRNKRGLSLKIFNLTSDELEASMRKLIEDPTYKKNAEIYSKRFKDRPESPVDTAMWWISYVMRHDNAHEILKPISTKFNWFQRRLLDVYAFFIIVELAAAIIFIKLFKTVIKFLCCRSQKSGKLKTS